MASPSRDSKQISFLAINMPHLLRFTQPTRYQPTKPSLAALHTYPNDSYQDDEDDNSSIYEHSEDNEEDYMFILKRILQTLLIQNIKPTMSRLFINGRCS